MPGKDEQRLDSLDPLDKGPAGKAGSATSLTVAVHPDYIITWASPTRKFLAGATGPLKWQITRKDGLPVDPPSAATITLLRPDNSTGEATPDIESASAAQTCVLAADVPLTLMGSYLVNLEVVIGSTTLECELTLTVN